jgi:hypothetical protein
MNADIDQDYRNHLAEEIAAEDTAQYERAADIITANISYGTPKIRTTTSILLMLLKRGHHACGDKMPNKGVLTFWYRNLAAQCEATAKALEEEGF